MDMLTISASQLSSLSQVRVEQFIESLTFHFRMELPDHCHSLGDAGTRNAIQFGIERAKTYGIQTEDGVTTYVRLMFLFGQEFDQNDQLPWAAAVLNDKMIPNEAERIRQLSEASTSYLRALQQNK